MDWFLYDSDFELIVRNTTCFYPPKITQILAEVNEKKNEVL